MSGGKSGGPATSMFKGMAILALAVIVSKLLGVLQKVPLQNLGGDEVFGIYNAVFPLYTMIMFLAAAGFPLAVSRFTAEYDAAGNVAGMRQVLLISSAYLTAAGLAGFGLLYGGAETIAGWFGSPRTAETIRSVSFALLFVPLMSALRGFFQGMGRMAPTAVSQVVEQFVRVAVMLTVLLILIERQAPPPAIAAGAMVGSAAGGAAGLAVMALYMMRSNLRRKGGIVGQREAWGPLAWKMAKYALAVCLAASITPAMGMIDSLTVPRLLQQSGADEQEALRQFGIYSRGLPLVQLVAMLLSSMSAAVIPALSGLLGRGRIREARGQAELVLRASWLLGLAASAGLAAVAVPVNQMLYTNTAGSVAMMIVAAVIAFNCWQIASSSVLQGWGAAKVATLNLGAAALCKLGLNLWLVPVIGIEGAAFSMALSFALAALLNSFALRRRLGMSFGLLPYVLKPLAAVAVMTAAVLFLQKAAWHALAIETVDDMTRMEATAIALMAVAVGGAVYVGMLLAVRAFTPQEWKSVRQMERQGNG